MTTRAKFSKKTYNEFVRQVELQSLWLDEMHLVRPTQYEPDLARLDLSVSGRHERRSDGGFDIYVKLTVNFFPSEEGEDGVRSSRDELVSPDEALMRIEVVYGAGYLTGADPTEPMLDHFSQSSGQLVLWPYLRETLQSTLLKAGQEGFVLPVFSPFL